MLEHRFALVIGAHFENVEIIIFTIGTPVILRRLERSIHLIQPCADQSRILGICSDNAAAAIEA